MAEYDEPYSTSRELIGFLFALETEIYRRENDAHGDVTWRWPEGHLHFSSSSGITLDLSEVAGASIPLDLAQTNEIVNMLFRWLSQAQLSDGILPSVHSLRVTSVQFQQLVSVGSLVMSGDLPSLAETTTLDAGLSSHLTRLSC